MDYVDEYISDGNVKLYLSSRLSYILLSSKHNIALLEHLNAYISYECVLDRIEQPSPSLK